jgi:DNA-binding PadR family transcriptional regulator
MRHGWHRGHHRHNWREFAAHMAAHMAARRGGAGDDEGEGGGPGGFWGRGGGRGWGGRGRALGHGDLRPVVLALIGEKPRHGYDLIRAIEEKFAGAYSPSPGAVYPLLTMLEEEGLIEARPEGTKKLFALTADGEQWLKDNDAAVQGILTRIELAASHYSSHTAPESVWEAWKTLKQAMNLPRAPWTDEEAERIRSILEAAARDIVRGRKS